MRYVNHLQQFLTFKIEFVQCALRRGEIKEVIIDEHLLLCFINFVQSIPSEQGLQCISPITDGVDDDGFKLIGMVQLMWAHGME